MRYVLFLLIPIFISTCADQKKIILPINAQFANISFSGYKNFSKIGTLENWPKDTIKTKILLSFFDRINKKVKNELKKAEKKGRYTYTDDKKIADINIKLYYYKHYFENDYLVIPVEVEVYDRSNKDLKTIAFVSFGKYRFNKHKSEEDYYFHYYGCLLNDLIKNFPAKQIAELFYPHSIPIY